MSIENFIMNKEFMDEFIMVTNKSFEQTGTYENVYYGYEGKLDDDCIYELLYYCEENKLLNH